ncbi:MAG: hypothetical protein M3N12_10460 [Verrucomicrobiota bacterium]|nr:hypothetical protein [Verrucomicrobiota bacterium]
MESAAEPRPSTFPAKAQYSKKFHFWLDEPSDWNLRVRQLRMSGWCVAKSGPPITAIRARLRDRTFEGRFDRERPEVGAYIGMPDAPRWCGFTVDVEVPFGKGRLELQVAQESDPWQKVFATGVRGPLFVGVAERERRREVDLAYAPARYFFWFDRPEHWDRPTSTLYITGWAIDRSGKWIHGIRAQVGSQKYHAHFGIERKHLAQTHPDLPAASRSGFALAVPLPAGKSTLLLEVKNANGLWHPLFSHPVIGTNENESPASIPPEGATHFAPASPARFAFWCDQPLDWDKPAHYLRVTGWCVTAYGEPITELRARVGKNIFPVRFGIVRPDIGAAFELQPNARRSGFSTRVALPRTGATFVLEGRSPGGTWEKVFSRPVRGRSRQPGRRA